jgi:hypothetical protein
VIPELRNHFNRTFTPERYAALRSLTEERCGTKVEYRVAETPVFLPLLLLEAMASEGAELLRTLLEMPAYLAAARKAIPAGYEIAGDSTHPHFLTADFALVREKPGNLAPRLVEIQAFPSVFGYQDELSAAYRDVFALPQSLGYYLSGLDQAGYWSLLGQTILGKHSPDNVVLLELDPLHQKTLPDFLVTSRRLGIAIVDIRSLEPVGNKLHYRNAAGQLVPIHRIYNRTIADELMARDVHLPFDLTHPWEVEWAGHPNWYFMVSKFSLPWLSTPALTSPAQANQQGAQSGPSPHPVVPPAVFLDDFLEGPGRAALAAAGVPLPGDSGPDTAYGELLLKPLFSFAGKGIQFDPTQSELEAIPRARRGEFLLQQRMRFEHTIDTPSGLTQAEIRILYVWPDGGSLTPAISLVRLGRGKMMGVDHNRNQDWVGASAAFFPRDPSRP